MSRKRAERLHASVWHAVLALSLASGASVVRAQEMEPRAYSPAPTGMNFLIVSLGQSSGGVVLDPSVPIENIDATVNSATLGYQHTFSLLRRTASFGVAAPYAWGDVSGDVMEERRAVSRSGLADARLRLSVNLFGAPAVDRSQFAAATRSTQIGASLTVAAPTGQYQSSKLVNLGSNRWAVKPEIGLYHPMGPWSLELAVGAWFFGNNDDFFGGSHRSQDPIAAAQAHLGYTFRPQLWAAADYTYYRGGQSTVDGVEKADLQASSRIGFAVSVPTFRGQSMKLAWSRGVTSRIGADFTTYSITFQRAW